MLRLLVGVGVLLASAGAMAQSSGDSGGVNVRFLQQQGKLTLMAQMYKNDNDRSVETGEPLAGQSYTPPQGGGIPVSAFTIVTVCALNYPGTPGCPPNQLSPNTPRFNVDKADAIGIASAADGTKSTKKRVNFVYTTGEPSTTQSAERVSLTFNCTNAECGPSITSGRIILSRVEGSPRVVLLYPTRGGTPLSVPPIVVKPGGSNPAGITATFSSGTSTIDLYPEALSAYAPFDGFQIGAGNAKTVFTLRLADVTFGQTPPDAQGFGCRIDLRQTPVADAFKFVLPASTSEKFCFASNGGSLKLACSGQIPGYEAGSAISTSDIECEISGTQCGIDTVFDADVHTISISPTGLAELECAVSPE
jgi:hypothetical protein